MQTWAIPNVAKNPQQSVTVVAHTVADWAGSNPSRRMAKGMRTPVVQARN